MANKLVVIINSFKVPKIKKILLYEMKFLVPNYSCLQNPWLGGVGLRPQIPVLSVLSSTEFVEPRTKKNSWVRHCLLHTYAIWYSLLLLGYKPVQHVTVLNTVGSCNTMLSIIILYYNIIKLYYIIILWDHRWCRNRSNDLIHGGRWWWWWDHRSICGPSLTETSLCGARLHSPPFRYQSASLNERITFWHWRRNKYEWFSDQMELGNTGIDQ